MCEIRPLHFKFFRFHVSAKGLRFFQLFKFQASSLSFISDGIATSRGRSWQKIVHLFRIEHASRDNMKCLLLELMQFNVKKRQFVQRLKWNFTWNTFYKSKDDRIGKINGFCEFFSTFFFTSRTEGEKVFHECRLRDRQLGMSDYWWRESTRINSIEWTTLMLTFIRNANSVIFALTNRPQPTLTEYYFHLFSLNKWQQTRQWKHQQTKVYPLNDNVQ